MDRCLLFLAFAAAMVSCAVQCFASETHPRHVVGNISSKVEDTSNNNQNKSGTNMKVRYDGDQLWFIESLEKKHENVLKVLLDVYGAILWRSNGKEKDVYLPKSSVLLAKEWMAKTKQKYTVIIEDIQAELDDQERQNVEVKDFDWENYHNFSMIEKFLKDVAAKFSDIVELKIIGHTFEDRPLYVVRIGNNNPTNKVIWIDGGTHGREWATIAGVTYIVNQLVTKWHDFPEHIRRRQWYIMPLVNPDGYEYSRQYERLWAKNRRVLPNGIGVDINSNYDVEWNDETMFLDPSSNFYRGQSPLSETENQCLTNFTMSLHPKPSVFLTFHNYGQVLFYPWAYKEEVPNDVEDLRDAAEKSIKAINDMSGSNYSTMASYEVFGPAPGGADDWAKATLGAKYVYTVETAGIHQKGLFLPPSKIKSVAKETFVIARIMSEVIE